MSSEIESIYNQIANSINEKLPKNWLKAWIIAEMEDDNGKLTCRYIDGDEKTNQFDTDFETFMAFSELRTRLKQDNKQVWDIATFTLEPSGKFEIEFEYKEKETNL